ncbi:unnamed protein product [Trichobilharzia szidati]|nr:unnamed protein product [Trichobilharzia szidati]
MDLYVFTCMEMYKNESDYFKSKNILYCQATVNSIHQCWPPTLAGHIAKLPCPANITGLRYDKNGDSFRECLSNGSWAEKADYSNCTVINPSIHTYSVLLCFVVGYIISMISVTSGISILQYFRSLRCVRNNIHTHLMIAILLRAVSWICLAILNTTTLWNSLAISNILICILAFGMIAVYSWMLIEGVHLLNILFLTFIVRRFRFSCYSTIGWGIPAVLTSSWAIAKLVTLGNTRLWREPNTSDPEGILVVTAILITLAINFLIMFITIFMLLTKLRGQPSGTNRNRAPSGYKTNECRLLRSTCPPPFSSSVNQSITSKATPLMTPTITTPLTSTPMVKLTNSLKEIPLPNEITQDGEDRNAIDNTDNCDCKSKLINGNDKSESITGNTNNNNIDMRKDIQSPLNEIEPEVDSSATTVTVEGHRTKYLKPSLKRSTRSASATAGCITPPNPSISEAHPNKAHITIITGDKKISNHHVSRISTSNNNNNNNNGTSCDFDSIKFSGNSSSIQRVRGDKYLQRKSMETNWASSTSSSLSVKELRKAIKAIIFLMPLLGYSQLIFLIPYQRDLDPIFDYINAIMLSTQGFWVALIYCFLNSEVQRVLRTRWRVLCSKLKNQPSERTRQKQSLTTVGSGVGVGAGVLTSQNNYETEYQMN